MKLRQFVLLACTVLAISGCIVEPYGGGYSGGYGGGGGYGRGGGHFGGGEGGHEYGRRVWH